MYGMHRYVWNAQEQADKDASLDVVDGRDDFAAHKSHDLDILRHLRDEWDTF
jgi:hypothetical protein